MTMLESTGGMCTYGKRHAPANLTVEAHHVVPVAWQLHWQPATPPFPGPDLDGRGMLWDARAVTVCPTHHRNSHHWIVELMRAANEARSEDPAVAGRAVFGARRLSLERVTALAALERFAGVGGSLLALVAVGEWGQV